MIWINVRQEYPTLSEKSIKMLMPKTLIYLGETDFPTIIIKDKSRAKLDVAR